MQNIHKYRFLVISIALIFILESCTGSISYQEQEHQNYELQPMESSREVNFLQHSQVTQDSHSGKSALQVLEIQDTATIPNAAFKTKEGHEIRFGTANENHSSETIHAMVDYNLAPGFSSRKVLPVITARDQNIWSVLPKLNGSNSKYLLHIVKHAGLEFLFLGRQGLKGGAPVYTANDSDSEDSQPNSYKTTLKNGGWPVEVYKNGDRWRARVEYPHWKYKDASSCIYSTCLDFEHNYSETITLSTRGMRESNWVINYSWNRDSQIITSINSAEMRSSAYELGRAKDSRRMERQNRRDERRRQEVAAERAQIERERKTIEAKRSEIEREKKAIDDLIAEANASVHNKKNEVKKKQKQLSSLFDDDEIDALESEINDLVKQIKNQEFGILEKGRESLELKGKINVFDKEITEKKAEIQVKKEKEGELKASIESNKKEAKVIREELDVFRKAFEKEVKEYNEKHGS